MKVSIELTWVAEGERKPLGALELNIAQPNVLDFAMKTPVILTRREIQVRDSILRGLHNKEIASELGVSVRTVKFFASAVYVKYGVQSRMDLVYVLTSKKEVA
jgi:DNA-binding NarL/FixJ family response regulator